MVDPQSSMSFGDGMTGEIYLAATLDGDLLVGNSLLTTLEVFSPQGTRLSRIDLGLKPIPVDKGTIKRYKAHALGELKRDSRYAQGQMREMLKRLEDASFDHLFADHLPLYRELLVDAEGNILVFRRTECLGDCPILIRVYSPQGRFVCETEIEEGRFGLAVDPRRKSMVFGRDGLIAMVEVKDGEEYELRVIRVRYGPVPR